MSFLNPTYLWAFLGLLVPIAIHLWSKKEGKTIKVGSIELLRESESKQTSSIKPNELWLLLLRMFIISLITLILAEPQFKLNTKNTAITYIIEPSLLKHKTASILNSINDDSNIRLLQPNFPELSQVDIENLSLKTPNYWQLATDLQHLPSDSIVVYTEASVSGFKGRRPNISKHIEWLTIATENENKDIPIKAKKIGTNIELLTMQSQDEFIAFEKKLIKESDYNLTELKISSDNPIKILLKNDDTFINDSKYIEASLSAISKHLNRTFEINKTQVLDLEAYDLVIWLSKNNPIPINTKKLLDYNYNEFSNSLIEESINKNHFHLTTHLNSENVIKNHLPEQLLNLLNLNSDLEQTIIENDKRIFSKAELLPTTTLTSTIKNADNFMSLSKWLWLILGLSMLCERIIASYRKQ